MPERGNGDNEYTGDRSNGLQMEIRNELPQYIKHHKPFRIASSLTFTHSLK
jgi:hypothetical protein